jgi:hypothetical protein
MFGRALWPVCNDCMQRRAVLFTLGYSALYVILVQESPLQLKISTCTHVMSGFLENACPCLSSHEL